MKIGIIAFSGRNNMPYLKYYEDIIKMKKLIMNVYFGIDLQMERQKK